MNVFVLSTGRSGTSLFVEACKHVTNYSCGHETRTGNIGEERFDYPDDHIEADHRLAWLLGRLDWKYGDAACYVHLKRNEEDTAKSFVRRYYSGITRAYRGDGILMGLPESTDPLMVSRDLYRTINANIDLFLKDKTRKIEVNLETFPADFKRFWEFIGAQGDLDAALAEYGVRHNAVDRRKYTLRERFKGKLLHSAWKYAHTK